MTGQVQAEAAISVGKKDTSLESAHHPTDLEVASTAGRTGTCQGTVMNLVSSSGSEREAVLAVDKRVTPNATVRVQAAGIEIVGRRGASTVGKTGTFQGSVRRRGSSGQGSAISVGGKGIFLETAQAIVTLEGARDTPEATTKAQ
jgi:hypothetical protein